MRFGAGFIGEETLIKCVLSLPSLIWIKQSLSLAGFRPKVSVSIAT